ncbi:MAG: hypothetical protein RIC06_24535 [Cyclobacteriaceae bacterium]
MQRSYHTNLKFAIRSGKCPSNILKDIPKSNVSRWRREDLNKYYNGGLSEIEKFEQTLEAIQMSPGLFHAQARILITFRKLFATSNQYFSILREKKREIVETIDRTKSYYPLSHLSKFFNISVSTYYEWKSQVEFPFIQFIKTLPDFQSKPVDYL